jgi:nucleoid-associated protein EbfC
MDVSQIMRQAQAMQAKIAQAQAKLEAMEVEGQSGGGMVKIRLSGKTALLGITIDPSLLKPEDAEMVEDLIKAAHEDGRRKLEEAQNTEMKSLGGGMGMLPGFKMPF